jgi:WD40 repeat protein
VGGLAFAGPNLLATGGHDHTIRIWRLADGGPEELLTLPLPVGVQKLAFTPDGRRLLVLLQQERAVRVWHLDRLDERLAERGLAAGLLESTSRPSSQSPAAPVKP